MRHWTYCFSVRLANVLRAHGGARVALDPNDFKTKRKFIAAFKAGRVKIGTAQSEFAVGNLGKSGMREIMEYIAKS